jgi:hypothetical protein
MRGRTLGVAVVVVLASGSLGMRCSEDLPPEITVTWTILADAQPSDCAEVGGVSVEVHGGGIVIGPCEEGSVDGVPRLDSVFALLHDADGNELAEAAATVDDTIIPLVFAVDVPEPPPEDCDVEGDEDEDGFPDCQDFDCDTDPDCDVPPVCDPLVTVAIVYDGGGSGSATGFKQNFVVLRNRSGVPYDLTGHSLQTAGFFLTSWERLDLPAESIPANGHYLIALGTGGSQGMDLPTPDETYPTAFLSTTQLVVALMPDTTPLTACPTTAVDLFSADQTACTEGTTVPAPGTDDPAEWYARGSSGCSDAGVNSTDFTVAAIGTPPNSASVVSGTCTCFPP